jgi:transcriptional regulator with XRE-family HTH domain
MEILDTLGFIALKAIQPVGRLSGVARTFGENLVRARARCQPKPMTQNDLADLLGHSNNSTISKWENSDTVPEPETIEKIASALGQPASELLDGVVTQYDRLRGGDLAFHAGDQSSDRLKGGRSDVATASRLLQLERQVAEQADLIVRLEAAARGLVGLFAHPSKNRKPAGGQSSSGGTRRKAG